MDFVSRWQISRKILQDSSLITILLSKEVADRESLRHEAELLLRHVIASLIVFFSTWFNLCLQLISVLPARLSFWRRAESCISVGDTPSLLWHPHTAMYNEWSLMQSFSFIPRPFCQIPNTMPPPQAMDTAYGKVSGYWWSVYVDLRLVNAAASKNGTERWSWRACLEDAHTPPQQILFSLLEVVEAFSCSSCYSPICLP